MTPRSQLMSQRSANGERKFIVNALSILNMKLCIFSPSPDFRHAGLNEKPPSIFQINLKS